MNSIVQYLYSYVNFIPFDQFRLGIAFFTSIPFGFYYKSIKNPIVKNAVGAAVGLFYQYFLYSYGLISHIIQTVLVYYLAKHLKAKCGKIIFIESMLYIAMHQIYRQITDYGGWKMDITTAIMTAVCKYISFGFQISDGYRQETNLTQDQKKRRIEKFPSFFEYFGFVHFFGSSVMGPFFDFYDYNLYLYNKGEFAKIPSAVYETFKQLFSGLFFIFFFSATSAFFNMDQATTNAFYYQPLWYKIVFSTLAMKIISLNYFGGFKLATAMIASTGITYNGEDPTTKKSKWNRIEYLQIWDYERAQDMRFKTTTWNVSIQQWLRRFIFERLYSEELQKKNSNKANRAAQLTFLVSVLWHGYYPGYFIAFAQWYLMLQINKSMYKWSVNYPKTFQFMEQKIIGTICKIGRWLILNIYFHLIAASFYLLSFEQIIKFYGNLSWTVNISLIVVFAFFTLTQWGQFPPRSKTEKKDIDTKEKKQQ